MVYCHSSQETVSEFECLLHANSSGGLHTSETAIAFHYRSHSSVTFRMHFSRNLTLHYVGLYTIVMVGHTDTPPPCIMQHLNDHCDEFKTACNEAVTFMNEQPYYHELLVQKLRFSSREHIRSILGSV